MVFRNIKNSLALGGANDITTLPTCSSPDARDIWRGAWDMMPIICCLQRWFQSSNKRTGGASAQSNQCIFGRSWNSDYAANLNSAIQSRQNTGKNQPFTYIHALPEHAPVARRSSPPKPPRQLDSERVPVSEVRRKLVASWKKVENERVNQPLDFSILQPKNGSFSKILGVLCPSLPCFACVSPIAPRAQTITSQAMAYKSLCSLGDSQSSFSAMKLYLKPWFSRAAQVGFFSCIRLYSSQSQLFYTHLPFSHRSFPAGRCNCHLLRIWVQTAEFMYGLTCFLKTLSLLEFLTIGKCQYCSMAKKCAGSLLQL